MAVVSNRIWRWLTLIAALVLLDAALTYTNVWPTPAVRWRGELSIELAVCLLAMAVAGRRLGPPSRVALRWLAAAWVVMALGRYADVTAPALYGRAVNLYWDARHLSAVVAMLARVMSIWLILAMGAGVVAVPVLLYLLFRGAFRRLRDGLERPNERRVMIALASAAVLIFAAGRMGLPAVPAVPTPVTQVYARQARLVFREMTAGARALGPAPAMRSDLEHVRGADVFLIFIESYGAVSYDRPELAASLAPSRARLADDIRSTGRDVVSAFVESPTFGGNSWLAHTTLLSGVDVRDEDTNVGLMSQKRDTMVTAFTRQGYRAVDLMPGLHQNWPEGAFYGFDKIYGETELDYRGPPFGWWSLPDQFAIARLDALEVARQPRAPLFVFFPTTNTHTPFAPTPPYQPDWPRVLTPEPYDRGELQQAWEQYPDWLNLSPGYANALAHTYEVLGGYLRLRGDRDFVMILIGDHQPPAAVSGEGASWDVPVHVVTSRTGVLDRLRARGFRAGFMPSRPALGGMHRLGPTLLAAFGDGAQAQD